MSSYNINELVEQFKNLDTISFWYEDINDNLLKTFNELNKFFNRSTITVNAVKNITTLNNYLYVLNKHKEGIIAYRESILEKYPDTQVTISLAGIQSRITIATELLNIAKNANKNSKSSPTLSTAKTSTTTPNTLTTAKKKQLEVTLTPEQWGIKFTADKPYFMDLLPARQSTIPVQGGRDVPNAMPGLNYKLVTQVGKQAIPGFSPVYQNLGIKGMQVTIVGAFTGGDGAKQLVDAPDSKDNFKTNNPFWSNAKGSPTLSDNPDRGGKLPELNAYNSYTEFVQVCQQGKHMEVEINLFQVYNQNIATQIGEAVRLQSKNGNPKFTGIVRSLDVYHATKERTWYTLIMDVTDFGMASKGAINLNNELKAAIDKAQAELDKVKAAEAIQAAKTNAAVVPQAESGNDTRTIDGLTKASTIIDNINAITDPNQKALQIECYGHMLKVLQHIQNSDIYVFKNYLTQIFNGNKNFGDFLGKLYNTGKYSDIKFSYKTEQIQVVSARVECVVIPLTTTTAFCSYHVYWKIDFGNKEQPITRYTEVDNLGSALENLRPHGQAMDFLGLQGTAVDKCEGTKAEKDALLNGLVGWNGKALQNVAGRLIGCVLGQGAALGTISAATGGLGTIPMAALLASNCGLQSLAEAYQTMFEFNNEEGKFGEELAGSLLTNFLLTLGTAGLGGAGSKIRGNGFRQGLLTGAGGTLKQGGTVAGASSTVAQTVNKSVDDIANILTNNIDNLPGKTVTSGNIEYVIKRAVKDSNGKVTSVYVKDANDIFRQIPVEKIDGLDISLGGSQPTVTTVKPPDPANSQPTATSSGTAGSTASILTKKIDDLKLADNITKQIKSLTPENQREVLAVINTKKVNSTKSFIISRQGQSDLLVNPEDAFSISSSGFVVRKSSVVYDIPYIDVTGSKVVKTSSVPNTTNQTASPLVPVSALDEAINKLIPFGKINANGKTALLSLSNPEKTKAILIVNNNTDALQITINGVSMGKNTNNPIYSIFITDQGKLGYRLEDSVNQLRVADLSEVTVSKPVTFTPPSQPPSQPSIPQTQTNTKTTQTQQPSTGGSSQSSVVQPPVGLSGEALEGFKILQPFIGKQLSSGKKLVITFKNGKQFIADKIFTVRTEDELGNIVINRTSTNLVRVAYILSTGLIILIGTNVIQVQQSETKVEDVKKVEQK